MKQPFYLTFRALLVKYLNENIDPNIVHWIGETNLFYLNVDKLRDIWIKLARGEKSQDPRYEIQITTDYLSSLCASVRKIRGRPGTVQYQIVRTAEEKRKAVNDLVPGKFHEWIVRFLLEESRTDWVCFVDKKSYQFQIKNKKAMGRVYMEVNGIRTNNPSYYIELILRSLCLTGILIEIDIKNNHYMFNDTWYEKEILREVDGEDNPMVRVHTTEQVIMSRIKYPNHTADLLFPCCMANHRPYF